MYNHDIYHLHTIYIYSHTSYVNRFYHQSFSLNMLFVFKEQRFQNMSIQQLQNWEIKLHFSRKLRASPAQAKKCIWGEVRKGPQNRWSLPWKESSQNTRGICPHNGGEKADNALQWRKGKRKQGAMSCPVAVVQLRLRIRLTEKSPRKCIVAGKLKP